MRPIWNLGSEHDFFTFFIPLVPLSSDEGDVLVFLAFPLIKQAENFLKWFLNFNTSTFIGF